ncbi:unnamed protein product [Phytophthora fragariaefolia]|uniref:Unnamed protein product n=1 Tax=Phytophthora fragariaefolia TaxID=1490495 RepID=A0A9W6XYQ6_9STRA|nr:unnamed protein product [Phytophthora fragariaefolia]
MFDVYQASGVKLWFMLDVDVERDDYDTTTRNDGRDHLHEGETERHHGEEKGAGIQARDLQGLAAVDPAPTRVLGVHAVREAQLRPDVAIAGLRHLTTRHCPAGTRGLLMDELTQLKKKRGDTVRQYSSSFCMLLRMIPFLEHGENEAVAEADAVCMYRLGMPVDWQVEFNRISRIWDLASIETQFELIERNERDEAILRNNRPKRNGPKQQQHQQGQHRTSGARQQHTDTRNLRSNNRGAGSRYCNYCKKDNHDDDHCFRNPVSPAFHPRSGNYNSHSGRRTGGTNATAAIQAAMVSAIKKRQDEEFAAMRFYSAGDEAEMTVMYGVPDRAALHHDQDPRMEIELLSGNHRIPSLLDTGCTRSVMDRKTTKQVHQHIQLRHEAAHFRHADGSLGETTHCAVAKFKLIDFPQTRTCSHEFRVAEQLVYPIMLGRDFLLQQRMVLEFERGIIEWDGIELRMDMSPRNGRPFAAVLKTDTECRAEINLTQREEVPLDTMFEGCNLTEAQKARVMKLVEPFKDLFTGALGTMKKGPYVLPLKPNAKPVVARPFPIPRAYYNATRREIQHLVDIGVLKRDSSSMWASPAFVVSKKDGSVRLVCDFRKLNERMQRNFYPTRDAKEMVRSVDKPKYKSVFDVPLSYYTRVLAPESQHVTAITAPLGRFVFLRLPIGVSTAPDEFQACMDEELGDLDYVRVYLDDILVTSNGFEEHMQHLEEVSPPVEDGISALPNKVTAILAIAPTRNRREERRFVGIVNFYSDMLPRRASLLAPLTRLTSPSQSFQWSATEQAAFDAVKAALAKRVLLAFPENGRPFHVSTDAPKLQLGAVITQDDQPLAFWSKKCNQAQTAYPANRSEILSILLVLREFRSLLLGQELHLHTDHLNLTYSTFHDVHMMRWRLEIEEFRPTFHYIPGSSVV